MTDRIGGNGGLASTAIEAALRRQAEVAARLRGALGADETAQPAAHGAARPFATELAQGVKQLDAVVQQGERVHLEILSGRVQDLHEVAAQIKQSDLTFKFALATRNKLVEAYREIMRMGV